MSLLGKLTTINAAKYVKTLQLGIATNMFGFPEQTQNQLKRGPWRKSSGQRDTFNFDDLSSNPEIGKFFQQLYINWAILGLFLRYFCLDNR